MVNGNPVKFKLDTGATVSVIPERLFSTINTPVMHTDIENLSLPMVTLLNQMAKL